MANAPVNVDLLANSWRREGLRSPAPPASNSGICQVDDCSTLAFVELKTSEGKRKICLSHFDSVKAMLGMS